MTHKIKILYKTIFGILSIAVLNACTPSKGHKTNDKEIMVFAGASLTNVLAEIVDSFEVNYHVDVKTNMASSGTLARQIAQGQTPDVYISASKKWANYVDSLGYILKGYKTKVAASELVLIAPGDSHLEKLNINKSLNFNSLMPQGRLSIGDPAHVPAGKYAKQSLEYYHWYKSLATKMLPAKDVRSALMVVELGEAPLGIVYRPDAIKSGKVKIIGSFPEASHTPIEFIGGVCKNNKVSKDFLAFLNSGKAKTIWEKYGFIK